MKQENLEWEIPQKIWLTTCIEIFRFLNIFAPKYKKQLYWSIFTEYPLNPFFSTVIIMFSSGTDCDGGTELDSGDYVAELDDIEFVDGGDMEILRVMMDHQSFE